VAERRVTQVVREARGVHHVGVAAEGLAQLPADLGDLEGVGQPGPDEVVAGGAQDLRLGTEPAQR
jgi:hypothetical protein